MGNLFASFNPNTSLIWGLPINWLAFFRVFLVIPQGYWLIKSKCLLIFNSICHYLLSEMKAILGGLMVPGHTLWLIGLFWLVLCSNFLGLVPYVFTPSRHLRYSVSLSLPIWLGYIIYRVVIQFEENMALIKMDESFNNSQLLVATGCSLNHSSHIMQFTVIIIYLMLRWYWL